MTFYKWPNAPTTNNPIEDTPVNTEGQVSGCWGVDVGACLKVNTRALGRGALHKVDVGAWMLGRALKLTREHLAVAPCTRLTQFLYI